MHDTTYNIDWKSLKRADGTIDLVIAYDAMYPDKRSTGFASDKRHVEYLEKVEALHPITSPEVAALALASL